MKSENGTSRFRFAGQLLGKRRSFVLAVAIVVASVFIATYQTRDTNDRSVRPPEIHHFDIAAPKFDAVVSEGKDVRFVRADASGGDGRSRANAAALTEMDKLLADLPNGGTIVLLNGVYAIANEVSITHGGIEGSPIKIIGEVLNGRPPLIRGNRANPYSQNGEPGTSVFRLRNGASNLTFSQLEFENIGNGAVSIGASVSEIKIEDVLAKNVRRLVENAVASDQDDATVIGLTIRRVSVKGFSKGVIRVRYDTSNVTVEDVSGDSQAQDGDNFAIGISLDDNVKNVVIRRVEFSNARDTSSKYWNGDGVAIENNVREILIENARALNNTDAGFDIKADGVVMRNVIASGNKRNFRLWGNGIRIERCQAESPESKGGTGSSVQVQVIGGHSAMTNCFFIAEKMHTSSFEVLKESHLEVTDSVFEGASNQKVATVENGSGFMFNGLPIANDAEAGSLPIMKGEKS